jgi:hypothetical protein
VPHSETVSPGYISPSSAQRPRRGSRRVLTARTLCDIFDVKDYNFNRNSRRCAFPNAASTACGP